MQTTLSIALLQMPLFWEDQKANIEQIDREIENLLEPVDFILLPEMWSTGFTMQPAKYAATVESAELKAMTKWAKQKDCLIAGSLSFYEDKKFTNSLFAIAPEGIIGRYDKRHLFSLSDEPLHYTPGDKSCVVTFRNWRIAFQICYDLRFPITSSNNKNEPYDVLCYVANWPQRRIAAWQCLLPARAVENQAYVAAVNRIGLDGNQIAHNGKSAIYNFDGEKLSAAKDDATQWIMATLSKETLENYRTDFPFLVDAGTLEDK
ncbi:MAG: hypothetical protein RIQ89_779 [Bacteroidota bacterium]|jgi:omega-amidase